MNQSDLHLPIAKPQIARPPCLQGAPGGPVANATPAPVIRVLVADDHDSVRSGLRQFINEINDMQVVADVGTALEVCKFLNSSSCDVLILDLGLPDHNGVELLHVLKETHPSLPVLVYTIQPEEEYAHYCRQAGAAGFLNKASNANQIVAAIRQAILAGGTATRHAAGPQPDRDNLPLASPV